MRCSSTTSAWSGTTGAPRSLPAAVPALDGTDLSVYREPYPDRASRRPLLAWARQVPVAGQPAGTAATLQANLDFLCATAIPVALLHAEPGVLVTPGAVRWFRQSVPRARTVHLAGTSGHFLPEELPGQTSAALLRWA